MALNPSTAAALMSLALQDAAGIDSDGAPSPTTPTGDFPADWADAYNEYAMAGIVPGAENTGGDASIIESALRSASSSPDTVSALAVALANYWATVAITPGAPAHGGTAVASVVNNAASLVSLFEAAIASSITSDEDKPWFETFVANLETMAVSSIVWIVTEIMPPNATPTPFPEAIT